MRRRTFFGMLGGTVAWPLAARAQPAPKLPQIGFLRLGPPSSHASRVKALWIGLRELGYVEGKNIVVETRWAETIEQLSEFVAEFVRMNVDIIFATSSTEVGVVQPLTKTIPVVFATHADPVGVGHVASLARPGGNITGLSMQMTELSAKGMELLQEIVPHATRFGVFFSPTAPSHVPLLRATEAAGAKLRIGLHKVPVQSVEDFEAAFATMAQERLDGVLVHGSSLTGTHSMQLAELTLKYRLPTMFTVRDNVEAGGLMSYSPDLLDLTRRAATYIDKYCRARGPPICQSSRRTSSSSWSITKLPRRSG